MSRNLVLLPGMLGNAALWQNQVEALAKDYTIMVGNLTHGGTMEELAASVLKTAPPKFALAGFSMGGIVAAEVARQAPDRVERLAFVGSNPFPLTEKQAAWWDRFMVSVEREGFEPTVLNRLYPHFVHPDHANDAALRETVLKMSRDIGQETMLWQVHAIQRGTVKSFNWSEFSMPTAVIAGREDVLCPPRFQEDLAAQLPDSELTLIENCGHLAPLEKPHAVTQLLEGWMHR